VRFKQRGRGQATGSTLRASARLEVLIKRGGGPHWDTLVRKGDFKKNVRADFSLP